MTIGAESLLAKYKTSLRVAEALLEGKLGPSEEYFVEELISRTVLEAAKWRLEQRARQARLWAERKPKLKTNL